MEIKNQNEKKQLDAKTVWTKLLQQRDFMVSDYKNTIKHTGGLLTSSMSYAYSKGLNDAMKLIQKEIAKDETVQEEEREVPHAASTAKPGGGPEGL